MPVLPVWPIPGILLGQRQSHRSIFFPASRTHSPWEAAVHFVAATTSHRFCKIPPRVFFGQSISADIAVNSSAAASRLCLAPAFPQLTVSGFVQAELDTVALRTGPVAEPNGLVLGLISIAKANRERAASRCPS
jgi:hypothetical protein